MFLKKNNICPADAYERLQIEQGVKHGGNEVPWLAGLFAVLIISWTWFSGRTSLEAWSVPMVYGGDAYFGMGFAKAFMDGDIALVFQKWVAHLNAPHSANWNDWPITEELIGALWGWLGRFIGLFAAANFMVLLCHLLAGLSFWFVGRELNARAEYVFMGAVAYALSHFSFARGLPHLSLAMYWHLPLLCLVSWWTYERKPLELTCRRGKIALFSSAIAGALNPYFAWMYIQFLGFAILKRLANREVRQAIEPGVLIAVTLSVFILFNIDTFSFSAAAGKNEDAVVRDLAALELYGLKLPELFLPTSHRWREFSAYALTRYYEPALIKSTDSTAYLGIAGIAGFVWLLGYGLLQLLQGAANRICAAWWQVVWVSLYSLVGGVNLVLGSAGLILFRGTNRFSIVILTLSLLFLVQALSKWLPGRIAGVAAVFFVAVVLWDQMPPRIKKQAIKETAVRLRVHKEFSTTLENLLPKGSMVFQLPVMAFPESPKIVAMGDYEHFRPYLHTSSLKYSYGTTKGRGDNAWQDSVAGLPPQELVAQLESAGFGAVIVNRKGYEDKGRGLIQGFLDAGRKVIADSPDMIAFSLQPATNPLLPLGAFMSKGWSFQEAGDRWAVAKAAEIVVQNPRTQATKAEMRFGLRALQPQNINVSVNGVMKTQIALMGGVEPAAVHLSLDLEPGNTLVEIASDVAPARPGTQEQRKLSFDLVNFSLK